MINLILDILDTMSDAPLDAMQIIIYLIAFICIWLLLRELKCWYWKINNITAEQKRQTEILQNILVSLSALNKTDNTTNSKNTNNSATIKKDGE